MIFHENRLPADDSHEISCPLFVIFEKAAKFEIVVCGALRVAKRMMNVHVVYCIVHIE